MVSKPLLSGIRNPDDFKAIPFEQLPLLADEIRETLIETLSKTGGHLASNLGVVELTMAMHRVFSTPHDQIVWDVGHQCYVHKLLTGRADRFDTLRTEGGISGFPRPAESEHDSFVCGHASTAVSAANGIAKAKKIIGDDGYTIAVLGDGALTGGLAYEGLANAGRSTDKLIVVLNDNRMSINQNVGYVARYLSTLRARPRYIHFKSRFHRILSKIPLIGNGLVRLLMSAKIKLKNILYRNSSWFEDLGFYYLGPIDGHDLSDLVRAFESAKAIGKPVLLHVETLKGKGCDFATESPHVYHGVSKFDIETGQVPTGGATFSSTFGKTLAELAETDQRICAITAAMQDGTGLDGFAAKYPSRCFDVGIAEEHAVTFASGLAKGGVVPVFAVYSTFLQRCYDQLLNDTAISNHHIVLAIDRAGVVPGDGETHQGIFDVAFLYTIPNVTIYSPATFEELSIDLKKALYETEGIAAVRYPKGTEWDGLQAYQPNGAPYDLKQGKTKQLLVVTYGRLYADVTVAAEKSGKDVSILKLNRIKPIEDDVFALMQEYERILFVEEGVGGVAEYVGDRLMRDGYRGQYRSRVITDFVGTCNERQGLHRHGLDADGIAQAINEEL